MATAGPEIPDDTFMPDGDFPMYLNSNHHKVFLKIQIPHEEHYTYMGQKGYKLKCISADTKSSIHFPDCNKSSSREKSNSVVIRGPDTCVEIARKTLRKCQPFVFTVVVTSEHQLTHCFIKDSYLRKLEGECCFISTTTIINAHKMHISFRTQLKFLDHLREGIFKFMEYITRMKGMPSSGFCVYDISKDHQKFVMGYNNHKMNHIMERTGTTISYGRMLTNGSFPEVLSLETVEQWIRPKPSTVVINGSFESVCLAWKELLKSSPAMLNFYLNGDQYIDTGYLEQLENTHLIKISRRRNSSGLTNMCILMAEKKVQEAYFVRKQILSFVEDQARTPRTMATSLAMTSLSCARYEEPREPTAVEYRSAYKSGKVAHVNPQGIESSTKVSFKNKKRPTPLYFNESTFNQEEYQSTDFETNSLHEELVPSHPNDLPEQNQAAAQEFLEDSPYSIRLDYEMQKNAVVEMMENRISGETRLRTPRWSGCLYSKSLPDLSAADLSSLLDKYEQNYCSNDDDAPYASDCMSLHGDVQGPTSPLEKRFSFMCSNYLDSLTQFQRDSCNLASPRIRSLIELLEILDLERYGDMFLENGINLMIFMSLDEIQLKNLRVTHIDCLKMLRAIEMMKQPARHQFPKEPFNPAPGYEREFL